MLMKNAPYQFSDIRFINNLHFAYDINAETLLFISLEIKQLLGIADEDVSSAALIQRVHEDDLPVLLEQLKQLKEDNFNGQIQFRARGPENYRWIRMLPLLASMGSQTLLLGNITDITDEIAQVELIAKYTHKKNSILHMLGHDLRGPINIAQTVLQLMKHDASSELMQQRAQHVSETLTESLNMINSLLSREFMETTDITLYKTRINIVKKIAEYMEEYRRSATTRRTFTFFSNKDEIYLMLDEAKFMQVMNNLMSNALKFTHPGDTVTVTITQEPEMVRFSFTDTGIGIPQDQLPRIFDKFTSAGRNGLNGEPTTGLGLSVVKDIVGWHGGKIWCQSEVNKGTTFMINIPINLSST